VQVYAVREISAYLREMLDTDPRLGDVWVAGECSNVSRPQSGHVYFTLKDPAAQLRAVFFAPRINVRARTSHLVENGHAVLAHGRVTLYEPRGELQLIVDYVQPEGAGALQAEFERLKEKLGAEGLFEEARKRPLHPMPRRIGVVTSPAGAVFHDICRVLERRWPLAEVVLAPAQVQGPGAVAGIIGGLEALNALGDIDAIILARGGGSVEELWAFNDETLARAIFASETPVVSAIGHETDFTIADFVADRRAPTPSVAAEIASPSRADIEARLRLAAGRLDALVSRQLAGDRTGVAQASRQLEWRAPDIAGFRQRVVDQARRSLAATEERQTRAAHAVGNFVWRLKSLDPYATLERGYAIVQGRAGVVSSVGAVKAGDAIDVRVRDGAFGAVVGGGAQAPKRRARRGVPEAQAPLFSMPVERA
jgi:exodeoxyribonuclease VII large subunit